MISPEDLKNDLIEGLEGIGLSKGENCYISGNVTSLARTRLRKNILLPTCLSSFQEVIGQTGTVFSPSASMNLCNTEIPFDIDIDSNSITFCDKFSILFSSDLILLLSEKIFSGSSLKLFWISSICISRF